MIVLARLMGSSEFGRYSFALAWTTVLAYPATLGLPAVALRFVAHYAALQDHAKLVGVIKASSWIALGFSTVVALAGIATVLCLKSYMDPGHVAPLIVALAGVPILALSLTVSEAVRGLRWFWLAWSPMQIGQPILLLTLVGAMLVMVQTLGASEVMSAAILAYGLLLIVQVKTLWVRLGATTKTESRTDIRLWITTALPFVWSFGATMVLAQAGTILTGIFRTPTETAAYNAAASTSLFVAFFFLAISASSAPQFAALHAHARHTDLQSLFTRVVRWTLLPSLTVTLVLVLFAAPIFRLFGPGFDQGHYVLPILAFTQLSNVFVGPVAVLLGMTGHQTTLARVLSSAAIAYVLLGSVATQFWGITGVALALCAVTVVSNACLVWSVSRNLGIRPLNWMRGVNLRGSKPSQ